MTYFDRDVFAHPRGLGFAGLLMSDKRTVEVRVNGALEAVLEPAPTRTTCLRSAASPDETLCLVAIKGTDTPGDFDRLMYCLGGDWIVTEIRAANPRAVAVWWDAIATRFVVYCQTSSSTYVTWSPSDGHVSGDQMVPIEHQGTAGIQQIRPDGSIHWRQDARGGYTRLTLNGVEYVDYIEAGDVIVGQVKGKMEGVNRTNWKRFKVTGFEADESRIAFNNGVYLISGWAQGGKEFTVAVPPFDDVVDDPPPDAPTPIFIAALPQKVWFAPYYEMSNIYGDSPELLGNAVFTWESGVAERIASRGMPMIVGIGAFDPRYADLVVAYYIERNTVDGAKDEYETLLDTSQYPEKPIIIYLDHPHAISGPRPAWIDRKRTWVGTHTYREPGEPLSDYEARQMQQVGALASWELPLMLAPQFFDRNGASTPRDAIEALAVEDKLWRRFHVVAIMPFADRRQNEQVGGMRFHPVLREQCTILAAACPRESDGRMARPNRFDYWDPSDTDWTTKILNVLMQTAPNYNLSVEDRQRLIALVKGGTVEPPPPPPGVLPFPVTDILRRYAARFPPPQREDGEPAHEHEQRARGWTVRFCEQVTFEQPMGGFGAKASTPSNPISKDSLAQRFPTRLVSWDLLIGTGSGFPVVADPPEFHDITGQHFVPVPPVNHLG